MALALILLILGALEELGVQQRTRRMEQQREADGGAQIAASLPLPGTATATAGLVGALLSLLSPAELKERDPERSSGSYCPFQEESHGFAHPWNTLHI